MGLPELSLSSLARTVGHWLPRTYDGEDHFDLNAPYQRGSVWTLDQRQALIKSLYMGLPVGSVVVSVLPYRPGGASYRIVDGKQRVETVRMFVADEFPIPFEWLRQADYPSPLPRVLTEGSTVIFYSEASERFRRWFDMGASLPSLEFKPGEEFLGRDDKGKGIWRTRDDAEILRVEAELYGLINGGGTPQTEEDMIRAATLAR